MGRSWFEVGLSKNKRPYLKKVRERGSSGRAPASQVQGHDFQTIQKNLSCSGGMQALREDHAASFQRRSTAATHAHCESAEVTV
jgi:hypothetical protein